MMGAVGSPVEDPPPPPDEAALSEDAEGEEERASAAFLFGLGCLRVPRLEDPEAEEGPCGTSAAAAASAGGEELTAAFSALSSPSGTPLSPSLRCNTEKSLSVASAMSSSSSFSF